MWLVANERAEGVAALGAMVVDERFGSLLGGSQGDAMDDSGGQGFGGVFAGGASVEERPAGGGAVGLESLSKKARKKRRNFLAVVTARKIGVVLHVSVECVGQPAVISRSAFSGAQRSSGGS